MDVGQPLGVGVAGHHDVAFLGQQGFKGVKELFLRSIFIGKELHVVNQQQIQGVVAFLEFVKGLALVGLNHIRDKLFCMDVENFASWLVRQQAVAYRVHQVGLAQSHATIDKQGVVKMTRHGGNMHGSGAGHAVGGAFHQVLECEDAVEAILGQAGGAGFSDCYAFLGRDQFRCNNSRG